MEHKFINTGYLESVSGGDLNTIKEIVSIFRGQVVEMYTEMKALLAEKNYALLGLLAHKAKSSVAIMGMDDLASMLKTFELQAKDSKETHLYESYISRFREDTEGAIKELDLFINSREPTDK